MLEQREVVLGDDSVRIESLPATASLVLLAEVTQIVSGAGQGLRDIPTAVEDVERVVNLGAMLQGLVQRIDSKETPQLIKRTVKASMPTWRDKPPEAFEDWYESRFSRGHGDLLTLLRAIFEWNYGEPVAWLKKTWAKLVPPKEEEGEDSEAGGETHSS